MRGILRLRGFKKEAGWWWRKGKRYYEDEYIEDHETEILARWFLTEAGEKVEAVKSFFDGL
jgi:hypothetical protein